MVGWLVGLLCAMGFAVLIISFVTCQALSAYISCSVFGLYGGSGILVWVALWFSPLVFSTRSLRNKWRKSLPLSSQSLTKESSLLMQPIRWAVVLHSLFYLYTPSNYKPYWTPVYCLINLSPSSFFPFLVQNIIAEHEIRNISCAAQDPEDLSTFAYITKDLKSSHHYCHVFTAFDVVSRNTHSCNDYLTGTELRMQNLSLGSQIAGFLD